MNVEVRVTLTIKGQQLELTLAEARELASILKTLTDKEVVVPPPWRPWYDGTAPMPYIKWEVNTCQT